jgi:hypothetical protein
MRGNEMKNTITINGRVGRWEIPAFSVTENEKLEVAFDLQMQKECRYIATFMCGEKTHTVTLSNKATVVLMPELINAGNVVECLLEVRSVKTDKVLVSSNSEEDGYFIEPLKLEQIERNHTAYGMLASIEEKLSEIYARLGTAEHTLECFKEHGVPLPVVQPVQEEINITEE